MTIVVTANTYDSFCFGINVETDKIGETTFEIGLLFFSLIFMKGGEK